ncbi:hypothetical protein GCM10009727_27230 [Actinomadura napierensis]|uniref:Acyl-CoA dehydrogenase/oxidase C-terminal domain-containing protein n=1 Tax=Actinomadura napierensis TaxID=267854 RepID=A0ABN2YXI3_9ACTN
MPAGRRPVAFGHRLSDSANIRDWIAEARIDIDRTRLLTLKAAWMMDTVGNKAARTEIAAIKVAAPGMALKIVDRAIQVHGGGGVTDDFPLANAWAQLRTLRLADGPDEVHKRAIALWELRKHRDPADTPWVPDVPPGRADRIPEPVKAAAADPAAR